MAVTFAIVRVKFEPTEKTHQKARPVGETWTTILDTDFKRKFQAVPIIINVFIDAIVGSSRVTLSTLSTLSSVLDSYAVGFRNSNRAH